MLINHGRCVYWVQFHKSIVCLERYGLLESDRNTCHFWSISIFPRTCITVCSGHYKKSSLTNQFTIYKIIHIKLFNMCSAVMTVQLPLLNFCGYPCSSFPVVQFITLYVGFKIINVLGHINIETCYNTRYIFKYVFSVTI